MIEHNRSLPDIQKAAPCRITFNVIRLLLSRYGYGRIGNPLKKISVITGLLPVIGIKCMLRVLTAALFRKKPLLDFWVFLRVWPDRYSMDIEELKRCPSAYLDDKSKAVLNYCYGLTIRNSK